MTDLGPLVEQLLEQLLTALTRLVHVVTTAIAAWTAMAGS